MSDLISRQAAIDACIRVQEHYAYDEIEEIKALPPAQPEQQEISYKDCADATLKMWMDNVVTDGEYNRIMDKLNTCWAERMEE